MRGKSGVYVETKTGLKGVVWHGFKDEFGGKVPVELVDENFDVIFTDGRPKKLLCDPASLKRIGYVN